MLLRPWVHLRSCLIKGILQRSRMFGSIVPIMLIKREFILCINTVSALRISPQLKAEVSDRGHGWRFPWKRKQTMGRTAITTCRDVVFSTSYNIVSRIFWHKYINTLTWNQNVVKSIFWCNKRQMIHTGNVLWACPPLCLLTPPCMRCI